MSQFDLPLADLETCRPVPTAAQDFDAFWSKTLDLARSHDLDPEFNPAEYRYLLLVPGATHRQRSDRRDP
jgi:cephalosporin-C deacetylase-like acetyl esterase